MKDAKGGFVCWNAKYVKDCGIVGRLVASQAIHRQNFLPHPIPVQHALARIDESREQAVSSIVTTVVGIRVDGCQTHSEGSYGELSLG